MARGGRPCPAASLSGRRASFEAVASAKHPKTRILDHLRAPERTPVAARGCRDCETREAVGEAVAGALSCVPLSVVAVGSKVSWLPGRSKATLAGRPSTHTRHQSDRRVSRVATVCAVRPAPARRSAAPSSASSLRSRARPSIREGAQSGLNPLRRSARTESLAPDPHPAGDMARGHASLPAKETTPKAS
jgi:hypothetical protein